MNRFTILKLFNRVPPEDLICVVCHGVVDTRVVDVENVQ